MSTKRITRGNVYADILVDRRGPNEIWHYIGQREGSPEILFWGHSPNEKIAVEMAEALLKQYFTRAVTSAAG